MDILNMSRKEFETLPHRKWSETLVCDSIIILPGKARNLHDSGYRCMDFVAVIKSEPICLLAGYSDAIHIDGIGGVHRLQPPSYWAMDCLPKSGLLRIWANTKIVCGPALSSFEIFTTK